MDIQTFTALRPSKEFVKDFVCPPYDVLTEEDVKNLIHEHSLLEITRPDGKIENADLSGVELHKKGLEQLDKFVDQGILIQEAEPTLYLYEEETANHFQRGVVGIFAAEDYVGGAIARHELTLAEKEADRTLHFKTLKTQTEPVFLFARKLNLQDLKGELLYELTTSDGVTHRLFALDKGEVGQVKDRFDELEKIYIADGHHRTASAAAVAEEFNSGIMAVVFDEQMLKLLPYHRKLKNVKKLDKGELIDKLKENFYVVEEPWQGEIPNSGEFYWVQEEFTLKLKWNGEDEANPASKVDAHRIQRTILNPIFNIENPRQDARLDFEGGDTPTLGEAEILIVMPPATTDDIVAVADKHGIMPPKSTWFEPKLLSGLFLYSYK